MSDAPSLQPFSLKDFLEVTESDERPASWNLPLTNCCVCFINARSCYRCTAAPPADCRRVAAGLRKKVKYETGSPL